MDFVNAEMVFLNSSPVDTELGEVGFHFYHFSTPYVAVSKGEKGNETIWILLGSKIGLRSQTLVNPVSYLVPSFTNDFKDMTIKRLGGRKEGSGTWRVLPQVVFSHIRYTSLAQSNRGVSK